jgi:hypothetical protein
MDNLMEMENGIINMKHILNFLVDWIFYGFFFSFFFPQHRGLC